MELDKKINHKEVMELIYDKKDENALNKVACLVYKYELSIFQLIEIMTDELKLSYKQKKLLQFKMLMVADLVINIIYDNKDKEDMYSIIDVEPKLID